MRTLGWEAAGWLAGQLAVLTALAGHLGLGPAGWLAGAGFTALLWGALAASVDRPWTLGPANRVTVGRAVLVGGVTMLVADATVTGSSPHTALLVAVASVALALDAVDGQVARRTGTASALGARFDMEVDAFLILVLSVAAASVAGPWVLLIGAMRYLFVAAAWFAPWLRADLPPSTARKAVCAVQGVVLVVVTSGLLPEPLSVAVAAGALGSLLWSFGRDTAWLWRSTVGTWSPAACAPRIVRTSPRLGARSRPGSLRPRSTQVSTG
ncbi:CDP-alcohol phosphatidyltransferase family protein [Amycolatopsis sp. 195334CR]|uniref:CDP-alcohol phosphatidyltransferase family protein n=1 Tax=Amycolatopsis sp. 195334CR TaxID=2814588 RepID=UPI001A8E7888|nr:CDP-alcohol phosphatidyltransferase family protein [Amycolatopsis sp. 195334CR]MBN6033889.1 CDP-alcohol phosphatidyltransferase family protein [Amycolatopsis sp. 195334CR]